MSRAGSRSSLRSHFRVLEHFVMSQYYILMDSGAGGGAGGAGGGGGTEQSKQYARDASAAANTRVDWIETPESHVFKADMPGLAKEDIKITVDEGRILHISGERKPEEVRECDKWHRVERPRGTFLRRFRLPEQSDLDGIKAKVTDGVLTISVPKFVKPKHEAMSVQVQ